MKKAYLVLSDGHIFTGERFGAERDAVAELIFSTGTGGYIETLTDPSCYGQIMVQTFPLIGNYGMIPEDAQSARCYVSGYVVREHCEFPSNFRSRGTLDAYLKEQDVPGICGIDTRQLTRILREHGTMNAKITAELTPQIQAELDAYAIRDGLKHVSVTKPKLFSAKKEKKFNVVALDYGVKRAMINELTLRGCETKLMPFDTSAEAVLEQKPDGVFLSNGPGDPRINTFSIAQVKQLLGKVPVFGICFGHQLLSLAVGADVIKMKYGHHGGNQPARELETGKIYITAQNHNYEIISKSILACGGKVNFENANDLSCEGAEYPDLGAYSVQFHPEACAGPRDTRFVFDRFIEMMGGKR